MNHKHCIIAMTTLLLVGSLSAELITFEDNWGNRGYNLVSSTGNGVEIIFSVDLMRLVETEVGGKSMYTVTIPGCFMQNDESAPNLAGVGRYIAIPQGARAQVTILNERTEVIKDVDIAPAPNIPIDSDDSPLIYKKDRNIYNTNAYYPSSPVLVSDPMKMRGVDCVIINICPFQYNPVTRELVIYKDLKVKVDFLGGNGHFGEDRLRNYFFEPILKGHLINYSMLPELDLLNEKDQGDVDYAIIVPDDSDHEAWADTIMRWRRQQGIYTEVYKLSQIGGNNASLIQNFIDSLYNNHNLVAFLLLSDYQSSGYDAYGITTQFYSGVASDNMYADVDYDNLPDMYHGRITSHDNTDLTRMVGKMLSYERQPPTTPRTYNRPLFACGWQSTRWFQLCTEIVKCYMDSVLGKNPCTQYKIYSGSVYPGCSWSSNSNTYMLIDYFGPSGLGYIEPTNPHTSTYWDSGDATGINREINDGTFIVQHRDHGSHSGWSEPYYRISHLPGLNNDDYPYVFSINCLTGEYDYSSEVFAEAFHRHQYGAVGIIAASATSYSFVNDTYVFGYYDCMFPDFMPDYPSDTDAEPNYGYGNLRPGYGNVYGKYFLEQSNWPYNPGSKTITYHLFHHHTGVFNTLFSEVPESLTVSHPDEIEEGVTQFPITANDSALIGLSVDDVIIGRGEGTGSQINITIPPQSAGDTILVTATLHNHYRYIKEVPVVTVGVEESPELTESKIWLNQTLIKNQFVINYALTNEQQVRVNLFDATGRNVIDLVNSRLSGKGSITCNTKNVAAGVYFLRIENGEDVTTKQVILVK